MPRFMQDLLPDKDLCGARVGEGSEGGGERGGYGVREDGGEGGGCFAGEGRVGEGRLDETRRNKGEV